MKRMKTMYGTKQITQLLTKAVAAFICIATYLLVPGIANAQEVSIATVATLPATNSEDAEYAADMAALTSLTGRNMPRPKLHVIERLKHIDREWPGLLRDYVNPLVRNMVANGYRDGLSLRTTLFSDNTRGLSLRALVARDIRGNREARLTFAMNF